MRARKITEEMKLYGIASLIRHEELNEDYAIPNAFDERVTKAVAKSVADEAVSQGMSQL